VKYILLVLLLLVSLSAQARHHKHKPPPTPVVTEERESKHFWFGYNIEVASQYKWRASFYEQKSITRPQPATVVVWIQRLDTEATHKATISKVTIQCNENKLATTFIVYYADLLKQKQVGQITLAPIFKPILVNSEEEILKDIVCKKPLTG